MKTNIIYVYNNHVEKKLCQKAVEERWSFLAYALSDHPFSEPITKPSKALAVAMKLVDRRVASGHPLKYRDLHKVFSKLNDIEREQYIDYAISRYALVDYNEAVKYFEDLEGMIMAIDSTEGGEWNQKEDYYNAPDTPFQKLEMWYKVNAPSSKDGRIKDVYELNNEEKNRLLSKAQIVFGVRKCHLEKYFHIKM